MTTGPAGTIPSVVRRGEAGGDGHYARISQERGSR